MDEAERCHRLAILDRGVKVADGTPQELQAATGMHILEVNAEDPYAAQFAIDDRPEVVSVTQLGVRLRVLIPEHYDSPVNIVSKALADKNVAGDVQLATPSLEDVFVAVTMKSPEDGQ
jgi:ABC-2 type transport system ATP-binding protein